jgi:N-acetylmuramoyl-L-alanine amidase
MIQKLSPNFKQGRNGYKPEIIVIHIMQGTLESTDAWFANPASQVSSHYGVGLNGEVHQYVKEEDQAWTQGYHDGATFKLHKPNVNPNVYCVSIEHEGQDLAKGTEDQLKATTELIRAIATRWNIPLDRDHIIGHYEVDPIRKPCCPSPDRTVMDKLVARLKPQTPKDIIIKRVEELLALAKQL